MNPHTNQAPTPKFGGEGQAYASYFSAKDASLCYGVGVTREYISSSTSQTKKLGEKFAKEILKSKPKKTAFLIGLIGELGGGKTTFLQGFAKGLGIKEKILSPTFVIIKRFQFNNLTIKQFNNFYHIDCYRIKKPKELFDLGFKEIISNPQNIVVIEWADRIRKILPKDTLILRFKFTGKNKREINLIRLAPNKLFPPRFNLT